MDKRIRFATDLSTTRKEFINSIDDIVRPLDEISSNHASNFQLRDSQASTSDCVGDIVEVSIFPLYKVSIAVSRREVKHLNFRRVVSLLHSNHYFINSLLRRCRINAAITRCTETLRYHVRLTLG